MNARKQNKKMIKVPFPAPAASSCACTVLQVPSIERHANLLRNILPDFWCSKGGKGRDIQVSSSRPQRPMGPKKKKQISVKSLLFLRISSRYFMTKWVHVKLHCPPEPENAKKCLKKWDKICTWWVSPWKNGDRFLAKNLFEDWSRSASFSSTRWVLFFKTKPKNQHQDWLKWFEFNVGLPQCQEALSATTGLFY